MKLIGLMARMLLVLVGMVGLAILAIGVFGPFTGTIKSTIMFFGGVVLVAVKMTQTTLREL